MDNNVIIAVMDEVGKDFPYIPYRELKEEITQALITMRDNIKKEYRKKCLDLEKGGFNGHCYSSLTKEA
jgi:hypothetical protein